MTAADANAEAVDRGDLDELVRQVDRLCAQRDWDGLVDLRDRCRRALERGRQLWPAASLCEYRLALEAPAPWAAAEVVRAAGAFALGPLAEVAASTHAWADLAEHLEPGPPAALCAHERVVRGEDLTGDAHVDRLGHALELPLRLQAWEPAYPLATYRSDRAEFPAPPLPSPTPVRLPEPVEPTVDAAADALRSVTATWTEGSNGKSSAVAVSGVALEAIAALGAGAARVAELAAADALALLAWAGASGGAHGRRRGMARGRFEAWWVLAALGDLLDDWPVPADDLGALATDLTWLAWDADEPTTGWSLRLAVEDPVDGVAWAVAATDHD